MILLADHADFVVGFLDVLADPGADLHHGLVHFGLDPLFQDHPALLHDLRVDVRTKIARDRIDGLVLLFDSDVQTRSLFDTALIVSSRFYAPRNFAQRYSSGADGASARRIAMSATASTIH